MKPLSSERGVALVVALLISMLLSAMIAGFLATVNADQASSGIERDQTQAYAAAHAGVEKLTADLGRQFAQNFSPTAGEVNALATTARRPNLPGITYARPDGTSGYRITFTPDANGNPGVEDPGGSPIVAGPYAGLVGLITPYQIEVTARTAGDAEVKMRREFQTVAIPVFQFGLFSENDLSFFAGPNFAFGGKVHTNQNLFIKQDNNATLTLQDRVTAVGEIVRQRLANGWNSHDGTVRMARAPGCPAAPAAANAACFNIGADQGSVTLSVPPATSITPNPNWADVSMGTSNGWIRNGRTGARRLDLPIVSDGALPVDLVRRAPTGEVVNSPIGRQRFYNMATLRILMSDRGTDLPAGAVRMAGTFTPTLTSAQGALHAPTAQAWATVPVNAASTNALRDAGYRNYQSPLTGPQPPLIDGWIQISRQDRGGNWTNVTNEILSLGFSGRRLSATSGGNGVLDQANLDNNCLEVHPNAIVRLQRYRDDKNGTTSTGGCPTAGTLTPSTTSGDYWPNVLYDAREGFLRDDENSAIGRPTFTGTAFTGVANGQPRMYWGGVMHYVEFDVRNFRRWLRNEIGAGNNNIACYGGGGGANCAMDVTGYVVYFSDRRTNRTLGGDNTPDTTYTVGAGWTFTDDAETGEFGFEDIINPASATSVPNNTLDGAFTDTQNQNRFSEDVNARDDQPLGCNLPTAPVACTFTYAPTLERYGGTPRTLPAALTIDVNTATGRTPQSNEYELFADASPRPIDRNVARVNRAYFFRRGLKLVNGGRGDLPANQTQGLTVASENPVYVEGNYNACVTSTTRPNQGNGFSPACTGGVGFGTVPGTDHVSAAVIADAVTLLSNGWNDIRSFVNPYDSAIGGLTTTDAQGKYNARQAAQTFYRLAIISGKGLNFQRPGSNTLADHNDFGTDGGAHNFLRYLENWNGVALNYRGSLISFFTSRQAVGVYKCCDVVYGAPTRGYNFDTDFLTPTLLPPRTPMFRDLNTLTFRQILRPTQ